MPLTGLLAGARAYGMFSAARASDFQLIQSITVGSGGASSVTFSNIPQTYTHLQLRSFVRQSSGDWLYLRMNSDSGLNYAGHFLFGDGSSAISGFVQQRGGPILRAISTQWAVGVTDILDFSNTAKNTTARSLLGWDANGSGEVMLTSSLWLNTAAVTALTIIHSTNTILEGSTFSLYGIR